MKMDSAVAEQKIINTLDEVVEGRAMKPLSEFGRFGEGDSIYYINGNLSGFWQGLYALDARARESLSALYDLLSQMENQIRNGALEFSQDSTPKRITDYDAGKCYIFGWLPGEEFPGVYRRIVPSCIDPSVRVITWQQ